MRLSEILKALPFPHATGISSRHTSIFRLDKNQGGSVRPADILALLLKPNGERRDIADKKISKNLSFIFAGYVGICVIIRAGGDRR